MGAFDPIDRARREKAEAEAVIAELLVALKNLVRDVEWLGVWLESLYEARDAIAKAEGNQ